VQIPVYCLGRVIMCICGIAAPSVPISLIKNEYVALVE
jgi:hypothetical protein